MKKRMQKANDWGARYAVILGDDELARGEAGLKNLTSGEQQSVPLANLLGAIVPMTSISAERLNAILARRDELQNQLASGELAPDRFVALSKEYAEVEPVAEIAGKLRRLRTDLIELQAMLEDPDMREMAEEELASVREQLPEAERDMAIRLLPKDAADDRSAMLEVRAGTGGDEAALFAGDLFRMYQRYAEMQGWKVEIISASESDVGGFKEVVASIVGAGVFAKLKFESGVHRVQRVPATESVWAHPHVCRDRRGPP